VSRTSGRFTAAVTALLLAALATGCGEGEKPSGERTESLSREAVIRKWADTLRNGNVDAAAALFAVPVIVSNGTPPITLDTRSEVRAFNATLPCGAKLLRTFASGRFVTAEFELTERPGRGRCGSGTGQKARTTFVIRRGRIVQWRRVSAEPRPSGPVA
jgi:hypothetical protein